MEGLIGLLVMGLFILLCIILSSIKQISEYERGVKFTCGKFSKIMTPGWNLVLPIFQSFRKIDIRTKVIDVPEQEVITKDNVSVRINAVIYYRIFEMKRVIAKVAEAEREKAAVITKAEGELQASENLAAAARTMAAVPGALHLRTLATINDVSSDQSNTIIFAIPLEVLRAFDGGVNSDMMKKVINKNVINNSNDEK